MEEDIKKLLKHKNDYDVWNGSKISRPYKMTDEDFKLIENILNELERLQKENDRYKRIKPIMLDGDYELNVEEFLEISDKLYNLQHDNTCLHCGKDTPLYCETCYQELISKNAELQLENQKLKKKHKMICELNVELLENIENFIPKQVLRNRIADLEEVKSKYNFLIGTSYRADGAINTLKEILGDE